MKYLLIILYSSAAMAQPYNPYSQADNFKKAQEEYAKRTTCPDGRPPVNNQCIGYVAVPVRPIECGGATASYNMQWVKSDTIVKKDCK